MVKPIDCRPLVATGCVFCRHLNLNDLSAHRCSAFPDGIPDEIIVGDVIHNQPYPGDHGIQYEQYTKEDIERLKREVEEEKKNQLDSDGA